MSVETDPIPPVPEHTPPLREDEVKRDNGKYFNQTWTRWFVSLRDKINVINDSFINLIDVTGAGILVKNGATWITRSIVGTAGRIGVTNGSGVGGNPIIDLVDTAVTPGSYTNTNLTVGADGRLTAASNGSAGVNRNIVTVLTPAAGVLTIDYALGDYFTLAPTANITSTVFTNLPASPASITLSIRFTQDTTPRTWAFPASFDWPGGVALAVSTASGAVDLIVFTSFDQGTTYQVNMNKAYA